MAFTYTVLTKILGEQSFKQQLSSVISILLHHSIQSVEILFGFTWGNFYKNWIPLEVYVSNIESEIANAEQTRVGRFAKDDFYILLNKFEIEILFCHEQDIHLSFNINHQVIKDIMTMWDEKDILLTNEQTFNF